MLMDSILFPPLKVKYNYYAIVAKIAVFLCRHGTSSNQNGIN
jgi:hypothetical protein